MRNEYSSNEEVPLYDIQPKNKQGYIKTELTDTLAILSKLIYWMKPHNFFKNQNQIDHQSNKLTITHDNELLGVSQNQLHSRRDSKKLIDDKIASNILKNNKPSPEILVKNEDNYLLQNAAFEDFLPHLEDCVLIDTNGYFAFIINQKKGTKFNLYDLWNGLVITIAKKPFNRINSTIKYMKQYIEWLNLTGRSNYRIITTGHSLGGTVAEYITSQQLLKVDWCESFNVGTSPIWALIIDPIVNKFSKKQNEKRILSHHVSYDYLSLGYCKGTIKDSVKPDDILPHKMFHFLNNIKDRQSDINESLKQISHKYKMKKIKYRNISKHTNNQTEQKLFQQIIENNQNHTEKVFY